MSSTSTPEQILRTAVSHHQAGDVTEAARLYRHVLEHDPNQADALNLLGVIAQQAGDLDQALHLFDQANFVLGFKQRFECRNGETACAHH